MLCYFLVWSGFVGLVLPLLRYCMSAAGQCLAVQYLLDCSLQARSISTSGMRKLKLEEASLSLKLVPQLL